jgi:hypothetical protein
MRGCCTRTQQCDASRERGYHALVRPVMAGCPRSVANSADGERTLVYRAACSIRFDIMLRKKGLCAHPDLRFRFARRERRASVWKEGGFQTLPVRCRFRSTGCRKSSPVSEADLNQTVQSADGRRLLDRMFDELTAGNVSPEEQQQANRIVRAKAGRISPEQFEQGMRTAKIFPFRLPGLTVVNDAPITAERRERGRIWVKQPVRVLGTSMFRAETQTLPPDVFISGIELPEDEIVGVRMYDMGGVTLYRPALFLIQLSNTTDTTVLTKIIEAAGIGVTLGTGALASAGAEASFAVRAFLWADRIAFALGTIASVIAEHRGWIIRRFGASGQRFLRAVEMLQGALYIYNIVSIVRNTPRLVTAFRSSFDEWSAAVRGVERELSATELQAVRTISDEANTILQQCAAVAQAASGPPQSGSLSGVESDVALGATPPPTRRR